MLVLQRLMTEWTKRSRGGSGAAVRNAVPQSLLLPPLAVKGDTVVHEARFLENDSFRCRDELKEVDLGVSWQLGAMTLFRQCDQVVVKFAYMMATTGAPERLSHEAFTLQPGEWGRLLYNGRFSSWDDGEWWYRKDVFNVAYAESLDRRIFLDTTPNYTVSEMARLR